MKKFLVMLMVVAMASFLFVGCLPGVTPEPEPVVPVVTAPGAIIDIAAIPGVTAPVAGATPDTKITATAQYTGVITWSPVATTFAVGTAYTATITLTPKTGFTLTGVAANFFTVAGSTSDTNPINSGVVSAVYAKTAAAGAIIDIAGIPGVTVPVTGATPDTKITATAQYTGVITWSPTVVVGGTFAAGTAYTATITLTPKAGFTLTGVAANFFTVLPIAPSVIVPLTDTNPINSGVVTAVYAKTAPAAPTVKWSTTGDRDGAIDAGETLILTFSIPMKPITVGTVGALDARLAVTLAHTHGTTYGTDVKASWNATNTVLTVTYITAGTTTIVLGDIITPDTTILTGFISAAGVALTPKTFTLVAGTTF